MEKVFIRLPTGNSLCHISTQQFFLLQIISQGNGKFVAYTLFLKCHFQNKLTGLRRVYVGMGSLV